MLIEMKLDDFVAELASSSPAPGGGTIAAVTGSFAAGLAEMVCNLTIGNPKYADAQPFLPDVATKLKTIRLALLRLADEDTDAFHQLMEAYRMPKETLEEREARSLSIETAALWATKVPMKTAEYSAEILELLPEVITYGNVNAISDCGVAMESAHTAGLGALMNVSINLKTLKEKHRQEMLNQEKELLERRLGKAYKNVVGVFGLKWDKG